MYKQKQMIFTELFKGVSEVLRWKIIYISSGLSYYSRGFESLVTSKMIAGSINNLVPIDLSSTLSSNISAFHGTNV